MQGAPRSGRVEAEQRLDYAAGGGDRGAPPRPGLCDGGALAGADERHVGGTDEHRLATGAVERMHDAHGRMARLPRLVVPPLDPGQVGQPLA